MSFCSLHRLHTRLSSRMLSASPKYSLRPTNCIPRAYATTTKGDTPNASNVSNPQAGSTQESDVKTSRAMEGSADQDNASVQSPISQGNIQSEGEKTPDNDEFKQNPDKPASEKRSKVESLGKRSMGPEDSQ